MAEVTAARATAVSPAPAMAATAGWASTHPLIGNYFGINSFIYPIVDKYHIKDIRVHV
jgi:hypothetical protein